MKIFGIRIRLPWSKIEQAVEDVAEEAVEFAGGQIDKAVAMLKQTNVGTSVTGIIEAVANEDLSGREKFERVVASSIPILKDFLDNGKLDTTLGDIEDLARQLVQSSYNDWNATGGLKRLAGPLIALIKSIF